MSINLSQIDELRKRASVSYSDAKEALEQCNGDMLEALVYLERNNKSKTAQGACKKSGFFEKIGQLLQKGSATRLVMHKKDRVIFDVSMNIAILIILIALPLIELIALGMLVALFTGYRFRLAGCASDTTKANEVIDRVCDAAEEIKDRFAGNKSEKNDGIS